MSIDVLHAGSINIISNISIYSLGTILLFVRLLYTFALERSFLFRHRLGTFDLDFSWRRSGTTKGVAWNTIDVEIAVPGSFPLDKARSSMGRAS